MSLKIAPSFMSANLLDIGSEIKALEPVADYFHIDIIDWHYVKNMCLTPQFIRAMSAVTDVPMEAHLYVDNVDIDLVDECLDAGAKIVTVPADVVGRMVHRIANRVHERGARMGIFLNPSQPIEEIRPYADALDHLLLMSVDPGFGGQDFIPQTYDRIKSAVRIREELDCSYLIAIDGNCSPDRFLPLAQAGADAFSLGRGLFALDPDTRRAAKLVRRAIDEVEADLATEVGGKA